MQEYVMHPEKKLDTHKKGKKERSRNCAMAASLQYLLVTMQETVSKGKNAKFPRKDTRRLCMVIRLKNTKKNLKKVVR